MATAPDSAYNTVDIHSHRVSFVPDQEFFEIRHAPELGMYDVSASSNHVALAQNIALGLTSAFQFGQEDG